MAIEFTDRTDSSLAQLEKWSIQTHSIVYQKGTIAKPGALPLPTDIRCDTNVPVTLRDGTTIFIDIYRPEGHSPVPAIISGGPYGKNQGPFSVFTDEAPWRFGIPQKSVSGLEKFEGLDPAYWCLHGYAIIHSDPRGVGRSEGQTIMTSKQDGEDSFDLIEFLASQPWCNQRVTMAGNSWLSQTQWFAAAEKPPHLTCIAPSEGWSDFYNDTICRGGIPYAGFWAWLLTQMTVGKGKVEDVAKMSLTHELWDQYWESRKARLDQIDIPMLLVASWTSALHTGGTFRGWRSTKSSEKWLRVHNSNEWPDLYHPENTEETRKFFDHYMKDVNNGWEFTPRVRLCILNAGGKDIINRPEIQFPLAREQPTRLYLDASTQSMIWGSTTTTAIESSLEMDAKTGRVLFDFTFTERVELTGYWATRLWIEAIGNDDADIFCQWHKVDGESNEILEHLNVDVGYLQPHPDIEREKAEEEQFRKAPMFWSSGGFGRLRASHRDLAADSTLSNPIHHHRNKKMLKPGEVVALDVELRPHGVIFEAGQKLRLEVTSYNATPELPFLPEVKTINKGRIVLHTGGKFDSFLVVPYIPGTQ